MILRRIRAALRRIRPRHLPQSALGKAITYTLDQWPALEAFLRDGRIEIDNNLVENAIRPTAIGKKNWLFIGEAEAGHRGAILYTLVESCRRRGIDPQAYLRDVLTRLPKMTTSQIPEVTPEAWTKARRQGTPTSRCVSSVALRLRNLYLPASVNLRRQRKPHGAMDTAYVLQVHPTESEISNRPCKKRGW